MTMTEQRQTKHSKQQPSQTATNNALASTLTSLIQQYLDIGSLEDAVFYSERLFAESPSAQSLHLMATCYFRNGNTRMALDTLRTHSSSYGWELLPSTRVLWARCCLILKYYDEGEAVLLEGVDLKLLTSGLLSRNKNSNLEELNVPCGAAGFNLLGNLCRKAGWRRKAVQYYQYSLQLDPMLFTSFLALSELGVDIDPYEVFGVDPNELSLGKAEATQSLTTEFLSRPRNKGGATSLESLDIKENSPPESLIQSNRWNPSPILCSTPTPDVTRSNYQECGTSSMININKQTNNVGKRTNAPSIALFHTPNLTPIMTTQDDTSARPKMHISNTDYDSDKDAIIASGNIGEASTIEVVTPVARARNIAARLYYDSSPEADPSLIYINRKPELQFEASQNRNGCSDHFDNQSLEQGDIKQLLFLICYIGNAYKHLCQYRCEEALKLFKKLPTKHFRTGWVQLQIGKAYFEMVDYRNAKHSLELMHSLEPYRIKGLDILSTIYWHLKEEVELCYLAQKVTQLDDLAAETWCVVGNCFSLQKEHESALAFFKRAADLDSSFAYSFTLCGHEYDSNEDFDNAIACFRQAVQIDDRHYNAWYGLGAIYFRLEKFDMAEYHFKRALSINNRSSVLHCNLGMLLHANKKPLEALATLEKAFQIDPSNPQARFQRAKIWISMERYQDALQELQLVRDHVPRESSVQFMLGTVYKKLGKTEEAMRCFLTALDLEPKDNNMIKQAIDRLEGPDVDEEASTF